MKKTILMLGLCTAFGFASKAQCDKTIKWTSDKTEFVDSSDKLLRSNDETVEIKTNAKTMSIVPNNSEEDGMTGTVTSYSCNWKDSNNGKTVLKAELSDPHGDVKHATVTIEGVNGKITMRLEAEEMPDNIIRLEITSHEEVKD